MFNKIIALWLALALSVLAPQVHAAPRDSAAGQTVSQGPRRHLAHIVFAGLAGAILGLSTLSFYGRPQDHLANVPIGFAIGVIGGAVYTTYKAAAEPREFYSLSRELKPEIWRLAEAQTRTAPAPGLKTGFVFSF